MGYIKLTEIGITDAQKKVLDALGELGVATPNQLLESGLITVGRVMLHRHLKVLASKELISRIGSPPKVYYKYNEPPEENNQKQIELPIPETIVDPSIIANYFAFTSGYKFLEGLEGFNEWFKVKQLPNLLKQKSKKKPLVQQVNAAYHGSLNEFCKLRKNLEGQIKNSLFDGTPRYQSIHSNPIIDHVYYLDFYSLPIYGKTRLGWYVQKAKVGDKLSMRFIDTIAKVLQPTLDSFIDQRKVDAILWVPHSLNRPVSLMDELKKRLATSTPSIKIMKAFPAEVIPQKSISDLQARIDNALSSNHILASRSQLVKFKHILIVDDAIGSNATIHSIAFRLRQSVPNAIISAISIVGSFKGFDVIQDI